MRLQSIASKVVLVGTCSLAAAGWFDVRVGTDSGVPTIFAASPLRSVAAPDTQSVPNVQTGAPPVRDRSAWQPSPVPSQSGAASQAKTSAVAGAQVDQPSPNVQPNVQQPGTRDRSAWQPSPVPSKSGATGAQGTQGSQAQTLPSVVGAPPMGGLGVAAGAAALVPPPAAQPAAQPTPRPALQPSASAADTTDLTAAAGLYTPLSAMFTTDRLEALFEGGLPAKRGAWVQQTFHSKALGREDTYMVWLPPDYQETTTRYPTLYLLHGVGGQNGFGVEEWLGYALTEDLDRLLALGLLQPMIVVLPNGEQGYWMNHADGGPQWADFVALDLVTDVDAHFRTEPQREKRAIGGLSMGGHGALQIALNHPDEFAIAGAHSPTIRPFETSPEFFGDQKWFAKYDPISLAANTDAAAKLAIWLDVGYQDQWRAMATKLAEVLAGKKAPAQFHVLEGEHEGWYWDYYLPEYLNFYSSALSANAETAKGAPVVPDRSLATIASALQPVQAAS